jgi:methanogenic corrinoid protein MtbC1
MKITSAESSAAHAAAKFEEALLAMDRLAAERFLSREDAGTTASHCRESLVRSALESIGQKWERGEVALSQVYVSGLICEELITSWLSPARSKQNGHPPMAIAVLGDNHSLGKRIVLATIQSAGFNLIDYGKGLSAEELAGFVRRDGIRILLISTLMLRSALRVKSLVEQLRADGGSPVRVIVGGAPFLFDPQLWREVSAFAMGRNSADSIPAVIAAISDLAPSERL